MFEAPFTANALIECIKDLGYEADLKNQSFEHMGVCEYITITTAEELEWSIYLGFTGPYFLDFEIFSQLYTSEDPHLEAQKWQMNGRLSHVTVQYDAETGNPSYINGFFILMQSMKCVRDTQPLESFVESSLLRWEDEFDELIAQLCPEIP